MHRGGEIVAIVLEVAMNDRFGRSFHDYVNRLRVDELKRRLSDPALAEQRVLAIGLDCGFSSKSTLNSNFKKWTGLTPSEYRQRARHDAEPESSGASLA